MSQVKYTNLFNAIKSDDLAVFSSIIKGQENICFGRFPLLSVCYLFGAKRIIKSYETSLLSVKKHVFVDANFEIYKKFKSVAGRCLRLYTVEGYVVSPIEMLAILHKDKTVKKLYKLYTIDSKIVDNLKKIYYIFGKSFSIQNKKIKIGAKLLNKNQRNQFKLGLIVSLSFVFVLCIGLCVFNFAFGFSTSFSFFKLQSNAQLLSALNTGGNYILSSDIFIDDYDKDLTFKGNLDGKNHTIYISSQVENYFLKTNSGSIKNLNIVYADVEKEISNSLSLFVSDNLGTIENVNISCQNLNLTCNKTTDNVMFVTGLATNNKGTIKNCSIYLNAEISALNDGECFVSGVAGKNMSVISNCKIKEGSNLSCKEVDVSGIVYYNDLEAKITNCKNYASITQTGGSAGWSPKISGIALTNYGKIESCYNLANLSVTSTNEESSQGNVFLGGITCMNYGNISGCLNKADLNASSKLLNTYCGGITAYSSYIVKDNKMVLPVIKGCGEQGQIDVSTGGDKVYAFVGGLAGFMYGELTNNYSLALFTQSYNQSKYFVGTCLGSAYVEFKYILLTVSSDVVLAQSATEYQIACLINNDSIVGGGQNATSTQILTLQTIDEIKDLEVYWDE